MVPSSLVVMKVRCLHISWIFLGNIHLQLCYKFTWGSLPVLSIYVWLSWVPKCAFEYAHKASMQVTTPLLFKLIPAVVHLGVLLRWFSPDISNEVIFLNLRLYLIPFKTFDALDTLKWFSPIYVWVDSYELSWIFFTQIGNKGDILRADSARRITLMVEGSHDSW